MVAGLPVPSPFVFDSGSLALDLVNTRPLSDGTREDHLVVPAQLDAWLSEAQVHPAGNVLALTGRLQERLVTDARALRTSIENLVRAHVAAEPPDPTDIETVNGILATLRFTEAVARTGGGWEWVRHDHAREATALLHPVAAAAVRLLTEAPPERVRQCDDDACVLWFWDTSRNGRRRWCSMERCGNRNKVAAHYRRQRESEP